MAYKSLIGSDNVECGNTTNSHNNFGTINSIVNVSIADENPEIMQWLSPMDARGRHHDVRTNRLGGVGSWLLETNEFRRWRSGEGGADEAILFCYGNPGVGKTYLSSLVIDNLCDEPSEEDTGTAIAMFYCDFRDQQQQTATNIVGAILKQFVVRGEVLGHVQAAFQKAKMQVGGRGLVLIDMVRLLKQVIVKLPRTFICIDALDECLPKNLLDLLESLKDILLVSPRIRIFVTGRPQVEAGIKRVFTTAIIIPIITKPDDIKRYLERRLETDTDLDGMSDSLREDIFRIIPESISEIFLLVSLNIDAILEATTISERRRKLMEMTKGNRLGDGYATTLERIKAQKGSRPKLGMGALMWVSNSERPLSTTELCHALGVEIGSADIDAENVPTIRTLLACSLGLITVDASSNAVRLVHLTLQEYLSSNPTLFQAPHSTIAVVCLTYLNFGRVRELAPTFSSAPLTFPLLEYASWYWGEHLVREKMESANRLALGLLASFKHHISSQLLLLRYNKEQHWSDPIFDTKDGPKGFTGLHGAAYFGIWETLADLLVMKEWDINARDGLGRTALAWAAAGGHEDIVKMLLQREDVNPNAADTTEGLTPLLLASAQGHEGVVRLLLEREDTDHNPTTPKCSTTPLYAAAWGGYEGIIKILFERGDVNINASCAHCGCTPLALAAYQGHERAVELLLRRDDINPNTADTKYNRTPLWLAAKGRHEGVAMLLLKRGDVNPNIADTKYGRTPLCCAVERGHEGVVKLLLERDDINPNTIDTEYGQALLCCSAWGGHEGIVKLLLERDDINPNTVDTGYGRTPLCCAAERGHEGVVKLLLERDDINPNTVDTNYGRTPLWYAARWGYDGVVKLLLERDDINPNTSDTESVRTPLSWAAQRGDERIVELLLERDDVNPDIPDLDGQTPLKFAASRQHTRVVELLSKPKPSLLVSIDFDKVLQQPSPEPADSPQSPSQPVPPACISVSEPLPLDTRPQIGMRIPTFMIIFSLVFLFCLHVVFSPFLPMPLSLLFHR